MRPKIDINKLKHLPTTEFIAESRINVWIYGHSHTNIDTVTGNTRIISNQMGYTFHDGHLYNGFEAGKYIEI